ncbi:hypothetical protein KUCAC02_001085, partial [Chaenocephalus aceratus]
EAQLAAKSLAAASQMSLSQVRRATTLNPDQVLKRQQPGLHRCQPISWSLAIATDGIGGTVGTADSEAAVGHGGQSDRLNGTTFRP